MKPKNEDLEDLEDLEGFKEELEASIIPFDFFSPNSEGTSELTEEDIEVMKKELESRKHKYRDIFPKMNALARYYLRKEELNPIEDQVFLDHLFDLKEQLKDFFLKRKLNKQTLRERRMRLVKKWVKKLKD